MDGDEALALFKDGLESTDRMVALETAQRLGLVAKVMGPNAARTVLLPYMEKLCTDQNLEDEVLCVFSETMDANFLPSVGGPATCFNLLKVLLPLATMTETAVRSRAVKSLVSLVKSVSGAGEPGFGQTEEWQALKAFLVNLSGVNLDGSEGAEEGKKEDPWFPSKLSACALYPAVLGCLPPGSGEMQLEKAQLLETLGALVDDEMPMVRAQAAASLGSVSAHVDAAAFHTHLGPALNAVLEDRSDVVRTQGVKAVSEFLLLLPPISVTDVDIKNLKEDWADNPPKSAPSGESSGAANAAASESQQACSDLWLRAAADPSWRVRLGACQVIATALRPADAKSKGEMLSSYAELLEDQELEVKLEATKSTAKVLEAAGPVKGGGLFEALVMPTILESFELMLANAKQGSGGAAQQAEADGLPVNALRQELQQAQALVAMELAAFDAIPHSTLVQVVQHMFDDPSLCIKMLDKFELLAKLKESDPAGLSQICMDSLSLGVHEDWRVRAAFTAKLAFIFEQIISVESSAAAAEKRAAEGTGATTPSKEANGSSEKTAQATPGTPIDKNALEKAWSAFKTVVDQTLWDEVAEARVHFVDCLPALITWADKIGGDKYVKQLVQMLLDQYKCESGVPIPNHPDRKMSYLYKTSVLAGLQSVLTMAPAPGYFGTPSNVTELVELLLGACKDPTPNVRLVACGAVGAYAVACVGGYGASPGAVQTVEMSLVPTLQTMTQDADLDVKAVAQTASEAVTGAMNTSNS